MSFTSAAVVNHTSTLAKPSPASPDQRGRHYKFTNLFVANDAPLDRSPDGGLRTAAQPSTAGTVLASITAGGSGILIYPNPLVDNKLNITNNDGYNNCSVFGADGRMLLQAPLKKGNNVILLPSTVSKGVYMVECTGKGLSKTFRVLKN